ncbi:hypothetical protein K8S19_01175 [bacterium]|nr:hypothetical protein [bacterium]
MEEVKALLRQIMEDQHEVMGYKMVEISNKWLGGSIVIKPGNPEHKSYEISLDNFLKKVISVREKLRVLEQKINNHPKLDDTEKIDLQQYITRCYGSLTTFNTLFVNEEDKFNGQS